MKLKIALHYIMVGIVAFPTSNAFMTGIEQYNIIATLAGLFVFGVLIGFQVDYLKEKTQVTKQ